MTDKEVGELWRFCCESEFSGSHSVGTYMCALMRKLVEERRELYIQLWKESYKDYSPYEQGPQLALEDALQSFGIDSKDWNYVHPT